MRNVTSCAAIGFLGLAALGGILELAVGGSARGSSLSEAAYPNDLGPTKIDVSAYPKPMQDRYKLFAAKCSACHTIARPINSQFLELTEDEIEKAKVQEPDLFSDIMVVRPEPEIWRRYIRRMMSKPACPVKSADDGKRIWEFLVYDSKRRKMGVNAKAWRERRSGLVRRYEHRKRD